MELISVSYSDLRQAADELNKKRILGHPCNAGNGECCYDTQIPLTPDDRKLIDDAVSRGEIKTETVTQAANNARLIREGKRKSCPFFDEESRKCTIYKSRPLACMTATVEASADNERGRVDARAIDSPIPIQYTTMPNCRSCADKLIQGGYKVPVEYFWFAQILLPYRAACASKTVRITKFAENLGKSIRHRSK